MKKLIKPKGWEEHWESFSSWRIAGNESILRYIEKFTPIEKIAFIVLYEMAQEYGTHHFIISPQKKIGKYTVDFEVVYHPMHDEEPYKKIIIECDGHDFHEKTREQVAKGKVRDRFLAKEGYVVLHYSGSELVNDKYNMYCDINELLVPERRQYGFGIGKEFEEEMRRLYGS